ncbi:hypothetical protein SAMN05421766_103532 [Zobellia uliginosa]|uniref:Outer membrane protein beta-barrel domain-containing protein n=1 Tax=Zobellia uliginosa TaxID=143224 RepID=A0ABY1KS99_9FLAO|nr:hypothetical protein [Zobellia uliginosa]SIS71002.1 hypothetical protein SAMN05421766_103532 [Zobellia uliginosa]
MKKLVCTLFYCLIFTKFGLSQDVIIKKKEEPVSNSAYSSKISKHLNFLLLGDNSPQQGISAVVNEKKTNVKISGLLYSGNKGVLSVEADLAASNGIFFLDQEKGSDQGKITFNFYKNVCSFSEYYKEKRIDKLTSKLEIVEILHKQLSEYNKLKEAVEEIEIQFLSEEKNKNGVEDEDEVIEELKYLIGYHINDQEAEAFKVLEESVFDKTIYELKEDGFTIRLKEKETDKENTKDSKKKDDTSKKEKAGQNKTLKDFRAKRITILKGLRDSIISTELKNAETLWAGNHIVFLGISPFYERQGLKRFSYDDSKSFKDMFTSEKGNIYGITLSVNYSLEKGEASKSIFKPENLFIRLSTSLGRASNFSNFKNSTLNINTPLGSDVNGNPVIFTNSDTAFIGDSGFEYGFSSSLSLEAYYYPFKVPVGLFGKIGYENIRFNRGSTLDNIEMYPMRLGVLFSLKNKEKDKPLLTIQTFLDRTDLNLDPSQPDNDLRFGIGIGLPINIK